MKVVEEVAGQEGEDEEEGEGRRRQRGQERIIGKTVAKALNGKRIPMPYKFQI